MPDAIEATTPDAQPADAQPAVDAEQADAPPPDAPQYAFTTDESWHAGYLVDEWPNETTAYSPRSVEIGIDTTGGGVPMQLRSPTANCWPTAKVSFDQSTITWTSPKLDGQGNPLPYQNVRSLRISRPDPGDITVITVELDVVYPDYTGQLTLTARR